MIKVRKFKLSDQFIEQYKDKEVPWGPVGYTVFKRTYARRLDEFEPGATGTEEWWQTCRRVIEGMFNIQKQHIVESGLEWNDSKAQRTAKEAFDRLFHLKWTPPGRGLWMMGTDFVENRTATGLFNCSFRTTQDLNEKGGYVFKWIMDALMLGVGVGFDTLGAGKVLIQKPGSTSQTPKLPQDFINKYSKIADAFICTIDDSREGWIESVQVLLDAFFTGAAMPDFDYSQIRPEGAPIKGFGGTSSGYKPLKQLHEELKELYWPRIGSQITSVDIVDTENLIGKCVVAGNVRRCLPEDAMVHCIDGLKKISEVKVGDQVLGFGGQYNKVTNVFDQGIQETIIIKTEDGSFECTPNHKMAVFTSLDTFEWVEAKNLNRDSQLVFLVQKNSLHQDTPSKISEFIKGRTIHTYDIEVENAHSFYCNGYLTHNSAALALGQSDDMQYLQMKNDQEKLYSHRWGSNNSFHAIVGQDYSWHAEQSQKNGEPGYIWLDNARTFGRFKDGKRYDDLQVMGFNPCFAGDTLVATADGRGAVPIEVLAEEGKDVPVYSMNPETGEVEIKMGRNPRVTGLDKELVEVILDDGTSLKVTPDHKFYLREGEVKYASELLPGDSLPRLEKKLHQVSKDKPHSKYLNLMVETRGSRRKAIFEHRLIAEFFNQEKWNDLYDKNKQIGWISGGLAVHHKDHNKLNNSPDNLEIMTWEEHSILHAKDLAGENNPMFGKTHSNETRKKIGQKSLERWQDESFKEKQSKTWTEERKEKASNTLSDIRNKMSKEYYLEQEATTDLNTIWIEDRLHARKSCEICEKEFIVSWGMRGQACCSISCKNKQSSAIEARRVGIKKVVEDKQKVVLEQQVNIYKKLSAKLGRQPLKKEWEMECRNSSVPFRIKKVGTTENPYALTSYDQLKELSASFNHKVVEVRKVEGVHPVYNISVDDHHTLGIATSFNTQNFELSGLYLANCSEQQLESGEACCLVETFPALHDSYEDYIKTLKIGYLYGKTVTLSKTQWPETNAIMLKNRRIGLSMSGIVQAFNKFGKRETLNWCDKAYDYVQDLDKSYSDWLCIPRSKRTTSIKPSGTVSLLNGSTPGMHFPEDEYYIRRIRFASDSPYLGDLEKAGYPIEDDKYSPNTKVVEFPVKEPFFVKGKREVGMWEQLEIAAALQHYWADNSVSVTITFKPEEGPSIKDALEMYESRLKSVSFLRYEETGYAQAPYEPITKEKYEEMTKGIIPIQRFSEGGDGGSGTKYCDGDHCDINIGSPEEEKEDS